MSVEIFELSFDIGRPNLARSNLSNIATAKKPTIGVIAPSPKTMMVLAKWGGRYYLYVYGDMKADIPIVGIDGNFTNDLSVLNREGVWMIMLPDGVIEVPIFPSMQNSALGGRRVDVISTPEDVVNAFDKAFGNRAYEIIKKIEEIFKTPFWENVKKKYTQDTVARW